jgi:hypothetical protein
MHIFYDKATVQKREIKYFQGTHDESIVEGSVDVGNTENKLVGEDSLGAEGSLLGLLLGALLSLGLSLRLQLIDPTSHQVSVYSFVSHCLN